MKIYKLPELCEVAHLPEGASVALGNFDGVHIGHRSLFDACTGIKAVWTFYSIAKPEKDIPYITDTKTRLRYFAEYGMNYVVLEDFEQVRDMSPESFVNDYLINKLRIREAVCGFNFRFGKNGVGNAETLSDLLSRNQTSCIVKEPVYFNGSIISSSSVRDAVLSGDMELAADLMGHTFSIELPVIHGKELGRTLGLPTINQDFPEGHIVPKHGIYATKVSVEGTVYWGVSNVGIRPTVSDSGKVNCETHIIDYYGNLYGKEIRVDFCKYLRDEKHFKSTEELKKQILLDIDNTVSVFGSNSDN